MLTRKEIYRKLEKAMHFTPVALACNLLTVYVLYMICRVVFVCVNWRLYAADFSASAAWNFFCGGLRFDTSAIFYTNALFILLFLLPLHWKERNWWWLTTKWIYVVINSLCLLMNLADSVFFEFRGQRTTAAIFKEFGGDGNIGSIVGHEMLSHWYLVILFGLMVWCLIALYRKPAKAQRPLWKYYVSRTVTLGLAGLIAVCGMRGNIFFLSATRPISTNFSFNYITHPKESGIVLNTPFSLIRTFGETAMPTPDFFESEEELALVYSPLHQPVANPAGKGKNVVILIVESFAQEFIGAFNRDLDNGTYQGYTPYTDAMLDSCMYFTDMLANTGFSIDAPPAILASIPRVKRPFVVSPHATNHINSLASELDAMGYKTLFFHGADNESLGIHSFTRQAGVKEYFGKTEFLADGRFGGMEEFDGTWGIWDEPFLQFFCQKLTETTEPFMAAIFTVSSHHPFAVPDKYADRFVDHGKFAIHKCISYTDYAIHRFFEEARRQPWFSNTVFVITADHASSKRTHDVYKTAMGDFRVPILIYDPSGELPRGRQPGLAQHIDIMPTLLGYLGARRPYIAFGQDLFNTSPEQRIAFSWDQVPQYVKGDYLLLFDEIKSCGSALYNFRTDPLLTHNLLEEEPAVAADMERGIKAMLQSYLSLMNNDNAVCR
ncbi:MAG: LTA synthase family protein [Muribaculaceae bacterium]|nr:LTA synthase family protein [Muribaculaceae bacterium]